MNNMYMMGIVAWCVTISLYAASGRRCKNSCVKNNKAEKITTVAKSEPLTVEMIADSALTKQEPKTEMVEGKKQFIAHTEAKLTKYQTMFKEVEQKQARSPWGTQEKYEEAEAAGESVPDTPPYHHYEKEKEKLQKKIQKHKTRLDILQSCAIQ